MKKSIIFYVNNDKIFTLPIIFYLINKLKYRYNIFIKLGNTSLRKKIKIILILILDGSIKDLYKFYKQKISIQKLLSFKYVKLIQDENVKDFKFGVSINYPKKIISNRYKIYNFHFGNFENQRGTFIFFYKYLFKWKNINLTFHRITKKFDRGPILNKKTINVKNKNAIDMISLPLQNKNFYYNSLKKINRKTKKIKSNIGPLNNEPTFLKIFLTNFKKSITY